MTTQLTCDSCNITLPHYLIDGKDDGTGNYTILHCRKCYGSGWDSLIGSRDDWNDAGTALSLKGKMIFPQGLGDIS